MDQEFKDRGVETGIPYAEDFFKYLEFLDRGIHMEGSSPANDIVREWDQVFFPDTKDSLIGPEPEEQEEEAGNGSHSKAIRLLYENSGQNKEEDGPGGQDGGEDTRGGVASQVEHRSGGN
ncbi:hypothetical protein VKT23_019974 [Stygiomarasmius scandens]|uniref:Uncharacterized protein n=1 Tax=Marasmiellus scandens TaxID=2682957 RepID=A0ABR1IPB0_9AGAR